MEATFSSWFLGPYKVSIIVYGLLLYAFKPAKRTSPSFMGAILEEYLVMQPAQPSKARLGGVHLIFPHILICTRLLQGELFKVTTYTAHNSSNGSHFLTAKVLVY